MATLTADATLNNTFSLSSGHHVVTTDLNRVHTSDFRPAVAFRRSNTQSEHTETHNWEKSLDLSQYAFTTAYIVGLRSFCLVS